MIVPMPALAQKPMTLDEWYALDEDEPGEIVDGFLVEDEVPGYMHEYVIVWLTHALHAWALTHGAIVAGSGGKFAIRADRGRMPDLTVYLAGAKRPPMRGIIRVPPTIAVEVVTPTPRDQRRDRVEKLDDYAAFGVKWYWLVDPELRTFEIFELGADGRYAHAVGVSKGNVAAPGCDGLTVDVSELWLKLDELAASSE